MLRKNHTSALILSLLFLAAVFAGYVALAYPLAYDGSPFLSPGQVGVAAALFLLMAFIISRTRVVMGLPEAVGFGTGGALRWLLAGLVFGLLLAALEVIALPAVQEPALRSGIELSGTVLIAFLAYYAAFRRSFFGMFAPGKP